MSEIKDRFTQLVEDYLEEMRRVAPFVKGRVLLESVIYNYINGVYDYSVREAAMLKAIEEGWIEPVTAVTYRFVKQKSALAEEIRGLSKRYEADPAYTVICLLGGIRELADRVDAGEFNGQS